MDNSRSSLGDGHNGRIVPAGSSSGRSRSSAHPSSSGRLMLPPPSLPKRRQQSKNIATAEDYEQLRQHYTFVLPDKSQKDGRPSTWQERMVEHYHSHLYKEFALADLSVPGKIGFCFRTKEEVVEGLGYLTCGNLRCNSFQQPDLYINRKMAAQNNQLRGQGHAGPPYGEGLKDFEVPFRYEEHGETKLELVKVRLCKVCIPKLMERAPGARKKKRSSPEKKAPQDRNISDSQSILGANEKDQSDSASTSSSSSSSADESAATGAARRERKKIRKPSGGRKGLDINQQNELNEGPTSDTLNKQPSQQDVDAAAKVGEAPRPSQEPTEKGKSDCSSDSDSSTDSSEREERKRRRKRKEASRRRRKERKRKRRKKDAQKGDIP